MSNETAAAVPTRSGPPRWLRPLGARLAFLLVVFVAFEAIFTPLLTTAARNPVTGILAGVATMGAALFAYAKLVSWLEERRTPEISRTTLRPQLIRGTLIGVGLFCATLALMFMTNAYRLHGGGSFWHMVGTFGMMLGVATIEELLFRGVLFRIVEERWGSLVALITSGVVFGGLHLLNPAATIWGAVAIAIEGGLLAGAAYAATRSLWLPIGIHLGWNFAESGIFGATVSGSDTTVGGLFTGTPHGLDIFSGGAFGPEASIWAVLVGGIAAYLLVRKARKQGNWR
ncbi:CPBP family intramembrane glutamic endopeptidase [Actinoplanes sp. L3-i22]|uniref:CPBP family intramembrane glutamic endopeptidase n=1 Tax=Actinoplanes sp. L3-i22 TaxID=2836373 RepID=UPI001C74FFE4|nr:CPBP family intramembrane glutamic endopeptidase [Actinoplanes sp. L3-i22]BCY05082.1 CAAX amino protease [Actinoplanes sp. L3-i22]